MGLFLLERAPTPGSGTYKGKSRMIVSCEDLAAARDLGNGYFGSDPKGHWGVATVTALVAKADYEDVIFEMDIVTPAGVILESIVVPGTASDDIDDIAALLVIALNATDSIANASYSTPNLVIATGSGGDDLGDHQVVVRVLPPIADGGDQLGGTDVATAIFDSIVDEGLATAALTAGLDVAIAAPSVHHVLP